MKPFFSPEPRINAIGGGIPNLPSNSFKAIHEGISQGADSIYLRIRFTADRIPVAADSDSIHHKNGSSVISQTPFDELKKINPFYNFSPDGGVSYPFRKTGESVKTAGDYLREFPESKFCFEICENSIAGTRNLCAAVNESGASKRVLFYSYFSPCIKTAQRFCPESAFASTLKQAIGFYALFRSGLIFLRKKFKYDTLVIPEFIGPSYLANPGLTLEAGKRGVKILVFGAKGEEQLRRLNESGIKCFITDDIPALKKDLLSL